MPAQDRAIPDGRREATYLITFSCYGQHLHGDERGSVDRFHNQPGSRLLPEDEPRRQVAKALMKEPIYRLTPGARVIVLETVREACTYRGWILDACHVRSNHVHVVVTSREDADRVMNILKARSSRALNDAGERRDRRWARHGSTKEIVNRDGLVRAIRYVLEGQGKPMAVWPSPDPRRST